MFQELFNQLPAKSVVLCILDELSSYETGPLRDDVETLCRRLTRFSKKQDEAVFKLMVTCRGRALGISQYFDNDVVELSAFVEPEDSSAWSIERFAG
jgi:hypothetical protein